MESVFSMNTTIMESVFNMNTTAKEVLAQRTDTTPFMLIVSILIIAVATYDYLTLRARIMLKKPATGSVEHGSANESDAHTEEEKRVVLEKLSRIFPGAMSSEDVLEGFKKVVEKRGYTDDNTLFAQSVCPDEVNHEEGDITDLFAKYCGEVFHLGGLAGMPFTGKVGFGAFSHHVPDGGHCAILYAPHIGLDNEGKFGSYTRDGQTHNGACCGAAVGAYKYCVECGDVPNTVAPEPETFQFDYIVNQVAKNKHLIAGKTECEKQASLIRMLHGVGHNMLKRCVGLDFGDEKSTLVIVTGIQINMPRPFDDYFLPIDFYIMKKDGATEDVFEEAFGQRR